jgi:hypothetical protein
MVVNHYRRLNIQQYIFDAEIGQYICDTHRLLIDNSLTRLMIMARTKKSKDEEKKSKHTKGPGEGKKGGKQRGGEERNWQTQRREEDAMKGMRHVPGVNGCKKVNDEWTCVKACAVAIALQFFDKKRSSKKRKKSDEEEEQVEESDDEDEGDKEDLEEKKPVKDKKSKVSKFSKKSKDDDVEVVEDAGEEQALITPISRKLLNAGTSTDSICKCIIVLTSILRMAGIRKAVTCWGVEVGEYDPNSGGPGRETKSCSMAEKQLQSNSHIAAAIASGEYTMQVLMSLTREKVSL